MSKVDKKPVNMEKKYEIKKIENFYNSNIISDWKDLINKTKLFSFFQSPEWVFSWWELYGKNLDPLVLGVFIDKRLIAIAPWYCLGKNVRCIGDPLNDLNDILVNPEYNFNEVLNSLINSLNKWLPNNKHNFYLEYCQNQLKVLNCTNFKIQEQSKSISPILSLSANFSEYLESLPISRKKNFLQTQYRFYRKLPNATFEIISDPSYILKPFLNMLDLRERSLDIRGMIPKCEPTSMAKPFGKLISMILKNEQNSNKLILGIIKEKEKIIAAGLFFYSNNILMKYMQGWAVEYSRYSPGMVLDFEMIKFANSVKIQAIDFGRGEEQYKFKFGAKHRFLYNYILSPL